MTKQELGDAIAALLEQFNPSEPLIGWVLTSQFNIGEGDDDTHVMIFSNLLPEQVAYALQASAEHVIAKDLDEPPKLN